MGKYDHMDNEKILELARKGISKRAASEELNIPFSSFKTLLNIRGISTEYTELSQKAYFHKKYMVYM